MVNINKELIQHVANVARLKLTDKEIEKFLPQLKEVLEAFSKLNEVNTDKVEPSFQPIDMKNVMRDDNIDLCLTQDEALLNAKNRKNGYFKGPKVL